MFFRKKNDLVKAILDRYVDSEFSLFACGEDGPTKVDIAAFERELGIRLPNDFRQFSMSPLGGIYIDVKEDIWPRPEQFAVGPFWTFLYGIFVYGFGKGIPDWMDIRIQAALLKEETGHTVIPVLKVLSDADFYCYNQQGKLYQWVHDTGELEEVPGSFLDLFERELKALKDRKEKMKAGEGEYT